MLLFPKKSNSLPDRYYEKGHQLYASEYAAKQPLPIQPHMQASPSKFIINILESPYRKEDVNEHSKSYLHQPATIHPLPPSLLTQPRSSSKHTITFSHDAPTPELINSPPLTPTLAAAEIPTGQFKYSTIGKSDTALPPSFQLSDPLIPHPHPHSHPHPSAQDHLIATTDDDEHMNSSSSEEDNRREESEEDERSEEEEEEEEEQEDEVPVEDKKDGAPVVAKVQVRKRRMFKSTNTLLPDELRDKYAVKEYLGSGSYGHVYLANVLKDSSLSPPFSSPTPPAACSPSVHPLATTLVLPQVAIKKIVHIFDNLTNAKRLLREIKILRMLKHKNVISFKELLAPPLEQLEGSRIISSPTPILPSPPCSTSVGVGGGRFNDLSMVFEFVETDLQKLIHSNQHFSNLHIQFFLWQLLQGLNYIHMKGVIHRDLKPANILVNADCTLKICDFGLSRLTHECRIRAKNGILQRRNSMPSDIRMEKERTMQAVMEKKEKMNVDSPTAPHDTDDHSIPLPSPPHEQVNRAMTKHVVTRWYRAPELILLSEQYTSAIDLWSIGCILAELLTMQAESGLSPSERQALFPGRSCFPLSAESPLAYADQLDQLNVIFDILGTPSESDLTSVDNITARNYIRALPSKPGIDFTRKFSYADPLAIDLLKRLLTFNPHERITAAEALRHPYLKEMWEGMDHSNPLDPINPLNTEPIPEAYFDWAFEDQTLDEITIRQLIMEEIWKDQPRTKEKLRKREEEQEERRRRKEKRYYDGISSNLMLQKAFKNFSISLGPIPQPHGPQKSVLPKSHHPTISAAPSQLMIRKSVQPYVTPRSVRDSDRSISVASDVLSSNPPLSSRSHPPLSSRSEVSPSISLSCVSSFYSTTSSASPQSSVSHLGRFRSSSNSLTSVSSSNSLASSVFSLTPDPPQRETISEVGKNPTSEEEKAEPFGLWREKSTNSQTELENLAQSTEDTLLMQNNRTTSFYYV